MFGGSSYGNIKERVGGSRGRSDQHSSWLRRKKHIEDHQTKIYSIEYSRTMWYNMASKKKNKKKHRVHLTKKWEDPGVPKPTFARKVQVSRLRSPPVSCTSVAWCFFLPTALKKNCDVSDAQWYGSVGQNLESTSKGKMGIWIWGWTKICLKSSDKTSKPANKPCELLSVPTLDANVQTTKRLRWRKSISPSGRRDLYIYIYHLKKQTQDSAS